MGELEKELDGKGGMMTVESSLAPGYLAYLCRVQMVTEP